MVFSVPPDMLYLIGQARDTELPLSWVAGLAVRFVDGRLGKHTASKTCRLWVPHACSCMQLVLWKASMNQKGKQYFTSKIIYLPITPTGATPSPTIHCRGTTTRVIKIGPYIQHIRAVAKRGRGFKIVCQYDLS
jgi:hypothetical protein